MPIGEDGVISEGLAKVLPIETNEVFYNPVQVFNRDLSILAISVFARESRDGVLKIASRKSKQQPDESDDIVHVFEGLAASGLRSIRYIQELKYGDFRVTVNDIESIAVERIQKNIAYNKIEKLNISAVNSDAIIHLHTNRGKYDVIDLDPYGSVSSFLDSAIAAIKPNGLLCITSTDGGVLCGNQVDLSFIRYGGFALKKDYAHEMGLRVLINSLAQAAGRYKKAIRVLAGFSIDFYFRMFVQVVESAEESLAMVDKIGHVFQCCRCEYHIIQPISGRPDGLAKAPKPARISPTPDGRCPECTGELSIGGPLWIGPIYDEKYIEKCLDSLDNDRDDFEGIVSWTKINGLLHGLRGELRDIPLFYSIPGLVQAVKCSPPKLRVFQHYLRALGYRVGMSHRTTNAIKTDAPASVVFDLLRSYVASRSEELKPMVPEILMKKISTEFPFEIDWNLRIENPKSHVPIYLPNPRAFWGPKARACTTEEFEGRANAEKKQKI